ncbi:M23 family metallopeptidase [Brachybacterium sp. EF45031]|nr:M23 family metallopeptidase [Brachybacterium sillae]
MIGALATATIAVPLASASAGTAHAPAVQPAAAPAAPAAAPTVAEPIQIPVLAAQPSEPAPSASEAAASQGAGAPAQAATAGIRPTDADATRSGGDRAAVSSAAAQSVPLGTDDSATALDISAPVAQEPSTDAEDLPGDERGSDATEGDGENARDAGPAAPASASGYIRPVDGTITSGYGMRVHPVLGYRKMHNGVDFDASCGTPVHAAASGTVVAVEYHRTSGKRVKIDHGDGVITGYYHLQSFDTSVGETVSQGEVIGRAGSTGRSTGCHLHFAKMDAAGDYSDPMTLLR